MKLEDWVRELCESLYRATGLFSDPRIVDDDGGHRIYFRLSEKLESKVLKYAKKVVSDVAKSEGWKVSRFTEKPGHVSFLIVRRTPGRDPVYRRTAS